MVGQHCNPRWLGLFLLLVMLFAFCAILCCLCTSGACAAFCGLVAHLQAAARCSHPCGSWADSSEREASERGEYLGNAHVIPRCRVSALPHGLAWLGTTRCCRGVGPAPRRCCQPLSPHAAQQPPPPTPCNGWRVHVRRQRASARHGSEAERRQRRVGGPGPGQEL